MSISKIPIHTTTTTILILINFGKIVQVMSSNQLQNIPQCDMAVYLIAVNFNIY